MKIILEYTNKRGAFESFSTPMLVVDNDNFSRKCFGYYEDDKFIPSSYTIYKHTEKLDCGATFSGLMSKNNYIGLSTATYKNCYHFYEYNTINDVPCSSRKLIIGDHEASILSIEEFAGCAKGINIIDYEVILEAAKFLKSKGFESRFVVFKHN